MIPAGRTAVDVAGLAEVYELSIHQLKRLKPWEHPKHPPTLTTGTPSRGHPRLWDLDQVRAHAAGQPIPPVPSTEDAADLLDVTEAAALLGISAGTWHAYAKQEREAAPDAERTMLVPPADAVVCGTEFWLRSTVLDHRQRRQERASAPRGGRPPGSTDAIPKGQVAGRISALLAEAEAEGETLSVDRKSVV